MGRPAPRDLRPFVRYEAQAGVFRYLFTTEVSMGQSLKGDVKNMASDYAKRYPVPTPEQFQAQLTLLDALAKVNAQANVVV